MSTTIVVYNRSNAIPDVEICLRTQFKKFAVPVDPFDIINVKITNLDPRAVGYDENVNLLETIPDTGIGKIGQGLYQYVVSATTIGSIGTFYDVITFQLEQDGPIFTLINDFEVTENGLPKLGYITVQDVRDEGLTNVEKYSDEHINNRIQYNTKLIERYTGRFFEARKLILDFDGPGAFDLQIDVPIVNVDEVTLLDREFPVTRIFTFDLDDLVIFNRHITMGLQEPDDRENPKIGNVWFPRGRQNVRVEGTFGYTEQDGSTPPEILRALTLMVLRDKELLASPKRNRSLLQGLGGQVKSESTDGHSYSLAVPTPAAGRTPYFTGNEEIDHLLHPFVRPPAVGRGLGANVSTSFDQGVEFNRFRTGNDFFFGRSL
ncbi:MAG: hypothetical protein V3T43_02830 [Nitrosomonadaceae bacterium]